MPELVDVTPGSPEWLAARRQGVTATDLPAILGISPYESAYSLYWRKQGAIPDAPDCPRFALGRYLEPYIAETWAAANGVLIRKAPGMYAKPVLRDGGLYQSDEREWQLATLDRIRYEGHGDISEPVECKSWADMDRDRWDNGPPATVRAQVLWQMDVMGVPVGHVAVLFLPSGDLKSFVIEHPEVRHPEVCPICEDVRMMRKAGHEFMDRLNGELPPPDADGSAASLAAARARFTPTPNKVAIIPDPLWDAYLGACDDKAHAEHERNLLQVKIREAAGDCGDLEVDGQLVARFDKRGAYLGACDDKAHAEHERNLLQVKIREAAGDCGDLEVDGQLVARFDKRGALRRIKAKEGDNDDQ